MLVIAKTRKGTEFIYNPKTAHKVTKKHAGLIAKTLNENGYTLGENETWFLYEVDKYDNAYYYAESQRFTLKSNGQLVRRFNY